jgi:hypothetical protein
MCEARAQARVDRYRIGSRPAQPIGARVLWLPASGRKRQRLRLWASTIPCTSAPLFDRGRATWPSRGSSMEHNEPDPYRLDLRRGVSLYQALAARQSTMTAPTSRRASVRGVNSRIPRSRRLHPIVPLTAQPGQVLRAGSLVRTKRFLCASRAHSGSATAIHRPSAIRSGLELPALAR